MSRFFTWLGIFLLVFGTLHTYFWFRIVRGPRLPAPWNVLITILLVVMTFAMFAPFVLTRHFSTPWRVWINGFIYTWMGCSLLVLTAFLFVDICKAVLWVIAGPANSLQTVFDPGRRIFLARAVAGAVGIVTTGVAAFSIRNAVSLPRVRRMRIPLSRLPESLSGTTIAQITDLHVADIIGRDYVESVVAQCNALSPDIVAITGDLVDGTPQALASAIAPLAKLSSKYGTYFVTGNHEYYWGVDEWLQRLRDMGIRVLENERVSIGEGNESFDLLGVYDSTAHRHHKNHRTSVADALNGANADRETILLAHQPVVISEAADHGVGLQISGHTHAGQIWPFGYLVYLAQPYVHGLHKHMKTLLYVSPGTGFWGPPMRFGTQSEITLFELVRA